MASVKPGYHLAHCPDFRSPLFTGRVELATWQEFLLFSVYEGILYWVADSPGFYFLGIYKTTRSVSNSGQPSKAIDTLLVDPRIYNHENWLTILIGVLLVLEGSKQLVRWAMWTPPAPFFGILTSPSSFAVISLGLSGVLIYTGYAFLQLKQVGFRVRTCVAVATAISIAMSWDQWDSFAREMVFRRRAFQGLSVRGGEVEFMQALMPEALIGLVLLSVAVMVVARKRLKY